MKTLISLLWSSFPLMPRTVVSGCLMLLMLMNIGCSTAVVNQPAPRYEVRQRVFGSAEVMPRSMRQPFCPKVISKSFINPAEINTIIDQMAAEGFVLDSIERAKGPSNLYTFNFIRPLPSQWKPTLVPREFTGIYEMLDSAVTYSQAESGNMTPFADPAVYYVMIPVYRGYTIYVFQNGHMQPLLVDTTWKGDYLGLTTGLTSNMLRLSADGSILSHVRETVSREGVVTREVYLLKRIQSENAPY